MKKKMIQQYILIKMDSNKKRSVLLFLLGCIGTRTLLVYLSSIATPEYLKYMGIIAGIISVGFMTIYLTGSRKTGIEVNGGEIWWNDLRPVHSILYGMFAYAAINNKSYSWIFLLIDVCIGLISYILHYYK